MELGVTLRNMGAQSEASVILRCAQLAEGAGLDSLWITDHIAIPPDDAEGSGGRYVEPLITLAWIAGATERIRLGTGVLILPYRGALMVGWMPNFVPLDWIDSGGEAYPIGRCKFSTHVSTATR